MGQTLNISEAQPADEVVLQEGAEHSLLQRCAWPADKVAWVPVARGLADLCVVGQQSAGWLGRCNLSLLAKRHLLQPT